MAWWTVALLHEDINAPQVTTHQRHVICQNLASDVASTVTAVCVQEALDAAAKLNDELREEMSAAKKLAAEASAKATDQHAVELQKMTVEQKKLQVRVPSYNVW